MCESKVFCHETGLAILRVLALTRNTYKNPSKAFRLTNIHIQYIYV